MKRWALSAPLLLLCTCVKTNEPSAGSQTHFLASCEASCPDPYVCSCGVCTLACTDDRMCAAESPNATCSVGPSSQAACRVAPAVCDVECTANRDCAAIAVGAGFACRDGRCREPVVGSTDAGAVEDASTGARDAAAGVDTGTVVDTGAEGGSSADAASVVDAAVESGSSAELLCDGSSDIRLGVTSGGGFVDVSFYFTNPYGHDFLFVDGQCRFYTGGDPMQGMRSGTLTPAQAGQLASALGWSRLDAWNALPEDANCPDGGTLTVYRPGRLRELQLRLRSGAPADKVAAFAQVFPWLEMLAEQGDPLTGGVAAIAQPRDPPTGSELAWPLSRPMISIEQMVQDLLPVQDAVPARFDAAGEVALLRALRTQASSLTLGFVPVSEAGSAYQLYVRDELPDAVVSAIDALLE